MNTMKQKSPMNPPTKRSGEPRNNHQDQFFFDEIQIIQPEIPSQQPASQENNHWEIPQRNQSEEKEEVKNTLGVRRDDGILLSRPAVAHLSPPPGVFLWWW
jgi:hypothetical protein